MKKCTEYKKPYIERQQSSDMAAIFNRKEELPVRQGIFHDKYT